MAITTKPTGYTVNTGHAKCPDHLWMLDEGTGTTLYDKGKASTKVDMTLYENGSASANPWGSESLGAYINCRDATVSTRYALSGTYTFEATTSALMVAIVKTTATTGTTNEVPFSMGNSGAFNNRMYLRGQPQFGTTVDAYFNDGTAAYAANDIGSHVLYDQTWRMVAGKFKNGELAISTNDGNWGVQTASAMVFPKVSGSTFNRYGIGCTSNSAVDLFFNGNVLAVMIFFDDYSNWTDAWLDDLYANPWQFLNNPVKKLKMFTHASAAGATGIEGVVLNSTRDTVIGEFSGKSFEASLESGKAVLKIPVADFGGTSLTTSDTPLAQAKNTTKTTGLVSCTVIEE